jgi:HD-GYP domain-containing protein (c-di-GMP phosphodiesterase class II)
MDALHELHSLFQQLHTEHGICAKLQQLTAWPVRALGAQAARLVCADDAGVSACPENVSFLPAERIATLPSEPGIINGKAPIPARLFDEHESSAVTVHVPVRGETSPMVGAFLLKAESPRNFIRRHRLTLDVLASKATDLIERAMLQQKLTHCRDRDGGHSSALGPDTIGRLMNLVDLPMYVAAQNGAFVATNETLEKALRDQRMLNAKLQTTTGTLQKTQATAMKSLAKLAEFRDKETGKHLQRICTYMKILATELHLRQPYSFNVGPHYADDIYLSGMLHDIGKVAIPDTILLKPGSLDGREWEMMKKHPQFGWSILHEADQELGEQSFLTLASRIALYHHERYDGTGYPHGLSGEGIPLSARIAAVADVYDALTSDRPYKSAWSHRAAIREIESERGRHFDPVLVDIFLDIENRFFAVQTESADEPELLN